MSKARVPIEFESEYDDPLDQIRENEEEVGRVAERDDEVGAYARYLLALAREEPVDDEDADMIGLPRLGGAE